MQMHPLDEARSLSARGRADESEKILLGLAAEGDLRAQFNLGWHHCRHGRLRAGIEALTVGRFLNVFGLPPLQTDKPIWRDQPLEGKHLLFRCEGGYGDQIANFRFARHFSERGAVVTVSCAKELFDIFRIGVPYGFIDNEYAPGAMFDYWMPAMSAPVALGVEYEVLSGAPYLCRPKPVNLPGRFRVGLRWAGNPKFEDEQNRRFPPELMFGLAGVSGATFYSLQRDDGATDLPGGITDLAPFLRTWMDTAQIIAGLDLVISSCTSVAHLAAAMGVPTWVVVPVLPYYLWATPGDRSPWYDSVRLFRQSTFGKWEEPFEEIRSALEVAADD